MTATDELAVDDTTWIIDKLGEDVLPHQDKRELTENAVQAVARALDGPHPPLAGEVLWDVDEVLWAERGVRKLCIVDNGDGFDAAAFRANIMHLAPRGKGHGRLANYGVGAKIAGVTRHPAGMVYLSWRGPNDGILAHLWRDPATAAYGLRRHEVTDGKFASVVPIDDTGRPETTAPTGTKVTLLGRDDAEDTFAPPPGNPHGGKWLSRYLNTRYFTLPEGVRVRVREGADYTPDDPSAGRLRTITGQRAWLDANSIDRGIAVMPDVDARVWWWILEPGSALRKDSHYVTSGMVATKFLHELFDLKEGPAAPVVLQKFGITFGFGRVVLVVEPGVTDENPDAPVAPQDVSVDLQRAHLRHGPAGMNWDGLATAFRRAMPPALRELVEAESYGTDEHDRRRRYRKAMDEIRDLYSLPRYRPTASGDVAADPEHTGPGGAGVAGGRRRGTDPAPPRPPRGRAPSGTAGAVYPLQPRPDGVPSAATNELPDVDFTWVSDIDPELPDRGGQFEDRAGRYVPETNQLLINADFRLFEIVSDYWQAQYYDRPAIARLATDAVRDVYTGIMVETVVGILVMRGDQLWSDQDLRQALSEEALTAAVMPRVAASRHVGTILRGRLRSAAA